MTHPNETAPPPQNAPPEPEAPTRSWAELLSMAHAPAYIPRLYVCDDTASGKKGSGVGVVSPPPATIEDLRAHMLRVFGPGRWWLSVKLASGTFAGHAVELLQPLPPNAPAPNPEVAELKARLAAAEARAAAAAPMQGQATFQANPLAGALEVVNFAFSFADKVRPPTPPPAPAPAVDVNAVVTAALEAAGKLGKAPKKTFLDFVMPMVTENAAGLTKLVGDVLDQRKEQLRLHQQALALRAREVAIREREAALDAETGDEDDDMPEVGDDGHPLPAAE